MIQLNGYVKIHRKLLQWGWYSDCVVKDVFLHLLITAAFKDGEFLGHQVKAGQAVIGYDKLSKELGFTVQQIRTALKKLESTKEISRFSTNKFTVVTVENWGDYQLECNDINKPTTNEQQTNNKPITASKECKEIKNNIGRFTPPTVYEISCYCLERNNGLDAETFFNFYQSKGWLVGKNKMKDWKAAVRTWESKQKEDKPQEPAYKFKL